MLREHAEMIVDHAGFDEVELCEGYSGRGMNGEETDAVFGSRDAIEEAIREVCAGGDADFRNAMKRIRWDSLGRSAIAY